MWLATQERRTRRHRLRSHGRTAVLCALVCFGVFQAGFNVLVEHDNPTIYDDEFSVRFPALQRCLAEAPGRPLLLLMGSSRCGMAYLPEIVPPLWTPSGHSPVLYNFSHQGAGPIFNLVLLQRLLRRGVRPRWLVLEVMPPCLNHEYYSVVTTCGELDDLPTIWRYFPAVRATALVLRARLFPCCRQRVFLCDTYLAPLTLKTVAENLAYMKLLPQGGDDGWWLHDRLEGIAAIRAMHVSRIGYRPRLQRFQIKRTADRALRETLELCRGNGIPVVLLLMPEAREFQGWYTPEALRRIDAYCRGLSREYDVPLVDARDWLPDDAFMDLHHPLRGGAIRFTERLAREVLEPLAQGRWDKATEDRRGAGPSTMPQVLRGPERREPPPGDWSSSTETAESCRPRSGRSEWRP